MKRNKMLIIIVFILATTPLFSSKTTTSFFEVNGVFKEYPILEQVNFSDIPVYEMPELNVDSILKEDNIARENGDEKISFAKGVNINYGMGHGKWFEKDDKRIWAIKLKSNKAYAINLALSDITLSKDAELYMFNEIGTMVNGPIINSNLSEKDRKRLLCDLISGDEIIICLVESNLSEIKSDIKITKLYHSYYPIFGDVSKKKHNTESFQYSTDVCQQDVVCYYPYWESEANSVCKIIYEENHKEYTCSGALLSNTSYNNVPYILSANHCGDGEDYIFIFGYKTACGSSMVGTHDIYSGHTRIARSHATDFLLLKLDDNVEPYQYFAGWNREDKMPQNATCIHHPRGDVMKIALDYNPIIDAGKIQWDLGNGNSYWTQAGTHFLAKFTEGRTDNGSSGSPLFNENHKVVGQYHGGDTVCWISGGAKSFFGRLSVSWEGGGTPSTRLKDWLDPTNTGLLETMGHTTCNNRTIIGALPNTYYDRSIVCRKINLQNVTVPTGKTLILEATEGITINSDFTIKEGAEFIIKE